MAEMSRRTFLQLAAGGTAALAAGVATKKYDRYIPYVLAPKDSRPGVFNVYPMTRRECPAGWGMHAVHSNGRVLICEGNPDGPINHGALCPRGNSAVQGLYDPDRLTKVRRFHQPSGFEESTWPEALEDIGRRLAGARGRVAIVSDVQTGALAELMQTFLASFDSDRLVLFEPFNYEALREAHGAIFGLPVIPHYRLDRCDYVLSFGADFLEGWLSPVEFARAYGQMRTRDGQCR